MSKLVIIGARAMGRETCSYARECGMEVKGFLDSKADALDGFTGYPPILDSVENYTPAEEDVFVVALGEPEYKMKYAAVIAEKGGKFVSIVHPMAYVGCNVQLGAGCIICPNSTITNDTTLGDHVIVNVGASVNHDNRIGTGTTICPGARLAGRVKVGTNTFIGTGALIIPDISLGDRIVVGAGAVVTKSFDRGKLVGVPAQDISDKERVKLS